MKPIRFLVLTFVFCALGAEAASTFETKIDLVQPGLPLRTATLKVHSDSCRAQSGVGPERTLPSAACFSLFQRHEKAFKKNTFVPFDGGLDSPYYKITFRKNSDAWEIKTAVSNFKICDASKKCSSAAGAEFREFVSDVNRLTAP